MRKASAIPACLLLLAACAAAGAQEEPGGGGAQPPAVRTPRPLYSPEVEKRLEQTGLVVLPEATETNLHDAYYDLQGPRYITADAMLYLWYEAHRQALIAAERQWLLPRTLLLSEGLLRATQRLRTGADEAALRGNAIMLEVTCCLLDPARSPTPELAAPVQEELQRVREHKQVQLYPGEDYTQYEVRGYYTRSAELGSYFRGAKYLARRYFRVADAQHPADADRELRRALLLALALREEPGAADRYRQLADLRTFLCGPVDTIGLDRLLAAANTVWGEGWGRERLQDLRAIRTELLTDRYPTTRLNSRIVDPLAASLPPRNVAVLGEHYLPDSELMHRTTASEVPGRTLPSGLDVATALGSPLAAETLRSEGEASAAAAAAARAFAAQMRYEGVYGAWLQTLRTLFEQPAGRPAFASTGVYEAKQLNCCLTSWTQLRHNYLLYGAQANLCLGASGPSPGLVEPLPGFFAAYARMCRGLRERLEACGLQGRPVTVLAALERKAAVFERCAADQLAGRDTTWATADIDGFDEFIAGVYFDSPLLVADLAADTLSRRVLHAASGPFHRVLVRYTVRGEPVTASGYVGSYYEFAEPEMGRVTDEEWQQRLQRRYGPPQPPDWLAGLYTGDAQAVTPQRLRLREIESLLLADRYEEARAAAEALIAQEQETAWAPEAVLLVGSYLLGHKRREDGLVMLERARPMYGCEARDAALRRVRNSTSTPRRRDDDETEERRRWAARLAATDPREGLTEAQELARQNRRAELLLSATGGWRWPSREDQAVSRPEERVLAECPRSGYVPYAALGALLERLPPEYPENATDEEPDPRVRREVRAGLLALADKYASSAVGQAARVAACSILRLLGQEEQAYRELQPLLEAKPPAEEPYPLSAAGLRDSEWRYGGPGGAMTQVRYLLERLLEALVPRACRAGEVARLREYLALERRLALDTSYPAGEVSALLDYLRDEPLPLAALLSLGGVEFYGLEEPGASGEPRAALPAVAQRVRQLVAQYPRSKAAPAALFLAVRYGDYWGATGGLPQELAGVLHRQYPQTLESLVIRAREAADREDEATVLRLRAQVLAQVPGAARPDLPQTYARWLADDLPALPPGPTAEELAAWQRRYAEFLAPAGVKPLELPSFRYEQRLLAHLLQRLPERELAILLAAYSDGKARDADRLDAALARHPGEPAADELRFLRGSLEDLAAIIAHGPAAPHYAEAVSRFGTWRASDRPSGDLTGELFGYRAVVAQYPGTPAAVLAQATMAGIYLHFERPEEALRLVTEALRQSPEGTALRERLLARQEEAQRQIALKRAGVRPPLWTTELPRPERPPDTVCGPRCLLSPEGTAVLTRSLLTDERAALVSLRMDHGTRRWAIPCLDLRSVQCVGDRVLLGTGHGTVCGLQADSGRLLWETPLGLSQTGKVWLSSGEGVTVAYWEQGVLAALDAETGKLVWQRSEDLEVGDDGSRGQETTPVVICGGTIVGSTQSAELRGWRAADGALLWSIPACAITGAATTPGWRGPAAVPPLTCGHTVVAGFCQGDAWLAGVEPATGKLLWRRLFAEPPTGLQAASRAAGAPILQAGGQLLECSVTDGATVWQRPWVERGGRPPLLAVAGSCAVLVQTELVVIDRRSGQVVARQPLVGTGTPDALQAVAAEAGVVVVLGTAQGLRAYGLVVAAGAH